MGIFDWLPCCGRRKEKDDSGSLGESASLLAPGHNDNQSVLSVDPNYGSTEPAHNQNALSLEQKSRIEEIGREVGGHMLPIHPHNRSHHSPNHPRPGKHHPLPKTNTMDSTTSSIESSRPTSPSPSRPQTSPTGGRIHVDDDGTAAATTVGEEGEEGVVVRKTVFAGGTGTSRGGRKARGRGRGRGGGGGASREVSGTGV